MPKIIIKKNRSPVIVESREKDAIWIWQVRRHESNVLIIEKDMIPQLIEAILTESSNVRQTKKNKTYVKNKTLHRGAKSKRNRRSASWLSEFGLRLLLRAIPTRNQPKKRPMSYIIQFTEAIFDAFGKECSHIFKGSPTEEEMIAYIQRNICDTVVMKKAVFYDGIHKGEQPIVYHNPKIEK